MKTLHISDELTLPAEAVTQTFGVLAVRGAGKSNLAAVMAEEMFAAGLPFVAVDPVGAWWGLRSSRDGRGPGLPLPIFGGQHADVALDRTGGTVLADLVASERVSCVLDVSEFTEGDKHRFLLDFATRLYQKNRDPLHLFLEEADDYAPQRPMREQARLLHAWQQIVRRGRGRGLGITMITQRSAALSKDVLTQIETLFVLRTTSPQDRKAIAAWVEYHGQAKDLVESLPSLEGGDAWVWSPHFLRLCKRVHIRLRNTFDSGATPKEARGKRPPATLADVDLTAVRKQMADAVERAKAEDPAELRKRIAQLERELKGRVPAKSDQASIDRAVATAVAARDRDWQKSIRERDAIIGSQKASMAKASAILQVNGEVVHFSPLPGKVSHAPPAVPEKPAPVAGTLSARPAKPVPREMALNDAQLGKAERAILTAFYWLKDETATPAKVAFYSDYAAGSSTTNNALGRLRHGLVQGWRITAEGIALVESWGTPPKPTGNELLQWLRAKLARSEVAMLDALVTAYPNRLGNEALGQASGYSNGSSTFNNAIGRLRTLEAAEGYERDGGAKAADVFFEG